MKAAREIFGRNHLAKVFQLKSPVGWRELGEKHIVPLVVGGRPEMASLSFQHPEAPALTTLLTVRMLQLQRDFLAAG